MSPVSEDSFVAVPETDNMSEPGADHRKSVAKGKGVEEVSPEGSVYYTVGDSDDGAEHGQVRRSTMFSTGDADVASKYPSAHDMAHIWEEDDDDKTNHPSTPATTVAVSSLGQTQPQHDDLLFVPTAYPTSAAGPSARLSDAVGNTSAVDLSSAAPTMTIRRGPRIRHDRLLRSETMATTQRAMFGPDEEALTADQLRAQDRRSHVFILLSTILTSASITLLVTCSVVLSLFEKHIVDDNQDLVADKGVLIACIAMGAVGTVVGFTLAGLAYFKHAGHRKSAADDDGNSWIEMNHRNKPLPRVPGLLAENPNPKAGWNDPKVNTAWDKFYQDKDGLRSYVEALEMRCARLTAAQDGGSGETSARPMQTRDVSVQAATTDRPVRTRDLIAEAIATGRVSRNNNGAVGHRTNVPSPLVRVTNSRDSTSTMSSADEVGNADNTKVRSSVRGSYMHAAKGSVSGQALIRRTSDAETDTIAPADIVGHDGLRRSGSEASILTVLCDAVTQPYSPLGERIDAAAMGAGTPDAPAVDAQSVRLSLAGSSGARFSRPAPAQYGLLDDAAPERGLFAQYIANKDDRETEGKGKGKAD